MKKVKTIYTDNREEFLKNHELPPNNVQMIQQDDKSFRVETSFNAIPVFVVNEILTQLHNIYTDQRFNEAMKDIPQKHKEYTSYLEKKCRDQRRWTLFWYFIALAAIAYIVGGKI